jgi:hypothetical protein
VHGLLFHLLRFCEVSIHSYRFLSSFLESYRDLQKCNFDKFPQVQGTTQQVLGQLLLQQARMVINDGVGLIP